MNTDTLDGTVGFAQLNLPDYLLSALASMGYETPTPIQQRLIPEMLEGHDVIGQAQTGTGKTAAFALPLLAALHRTKKKVPQVLVLAPTRELAIQVANAFRDFAAHMKGINILPIFGGQEYGSQLNQLKKGAQIIVGTPGRVMDHIKKGTLDTSGIHSFVLDEADEMLKMGFLEDVQWILEQLTAREHTALFSATMPDNIRKIAQIHLHNPVEIRIASPMTTAQTVRQKAILINGGFNKKIDAALNVLETIHYEGVLLFVRTKIQTLELAEKLSAKGYKATALNGDIQQSHRIRTIEQLKKGAIDILVATDVAARGLDVDRISHVINFDIPFETEAYVHRIGRTGRAGRSGDAILFVTPRERPMLKAIERATGQKISMGRLPTISEINTIRIEKFKQQINAALTEDISFYEKLISEYSTESGKDTARIAAALAYLHQGKAPLLLAEKKRPQRTSKNDTENCFTPKDRRNRKRSHHIQLPPEEGLERFRLEIGGDHGITPSNIVGAIANEADINARYIGRISIFNEYSTVDLPYGMPKNILNVLRRARIGNRMLKLHRETTFLEQADAASNEECRKTGNHPQQSKGRKKIRGGNSKKRAGKRG